MRKIFRFIPLCFLATLLTLPPCSEASDTSDVEGSVIDLYRQMSAHNTPGALRYISHSGFTEISPTYPQPTHLNASDVEAVLRSSVRVHLAVRDMQTTVFGDTAVVSGMRIGGIDRPSPVPDDRNLQFTMVWKRVEGNWFFFNLHLARVNE